VKNEDVVGRRYRTFVLFDLREIIELC
jgi:hypothetical protein